MPSPAAERKPIQTDSAETTIDTELKPRKENPEKGKLLADISPESKITSLEGILKALPTYEDAQAFLKGDKSVALMDSLSAVVVRGLVESTTPSNYRQTVEAKIAELKQQIPPDRKEISLERHGVVEQISSPEEFESLVKLLEKHIADEIEALAYLDKGFLAKIKRIFTGFKERASAAAELKAHQQEMKKIAKLTEQAGWDTSENWKDPKVQSTIRRLLEQFQLQRQKVQETLTNGADLPTPSDYVPAQEEVPATVQRASAEEANTLPDIGALETIEPAIAQAEDNPVATPADDITEETVIAPPTEEMLDDTTRMMHDKDFEVVKAASENQRLQAEQRAAEAQERALHETAAPLEQEDRQLQSYARTYIEITQLNQQLLIAKEESMAEAFAQDATLRELRTQLSDSQFSQYRKPNGKIDSNAPVALRRAFNTINERITARERALRKQTQDQPEAALIRQQIDSAQREARALKNALPPEVLQRCEDVVNYMNIPMVRLCEEMTKAAPREVLGRYEQQVRAEKLAKERVLSASWEKSKARGERIIAFGRRFGLEPDQAIEAVQQNEWPMEIKRMGANGTEEVMRLGMEPVIVSERTRLTNRLRNAQEQLKELRGVLLPEEATIVDQLFQQRSEAWNTAEQIFSATNNHPELFEEVLGITAAYNTINQVDQRITQFLNHPKYAQRKFASATSVWATQERTTPERAAKSTPEQPVNATDVTEFLEYLDDKNAPTSQEAKTQDRIPAKEDLRENPVEPKEAADQAA